MRAHHRPHLNPRETIILLCAGLSGIAVLGALIAANTRWSATIPGGGGFFSVWAASRAFLFHHADPYGATAAAQAQELVYGAAPDPTQNPYRLDLPFFLMPLFFPLGLIADPNIARGVWATMAQLSLVAATLICARLVEWKVPRAWLLALGLTALVSYPAVSALIDGTLVAILVLVYVAIIWFIQTGNDELAGALGVLTLCKWEVGLPFLLIVALRTVQDRRWRIVAGFGMTLTILLVLAFLVYPGWFMPFLVGMVSMLRSGHGVSTQSALLELLPDTAPKSAMAVTAVIVTLLVVEVLGARGFDFRRFTWTACLALVAAPLVGLRSEVPNLVTAIPGLVMIAAGGSQRRPYGRWISCGILAVLISGPWIVASTDLRNLNARSETVIFLLLPSACLIGMYWTRWWFLRPARTWMDEIREAR